MSGPLADPDALMQLSAMLVTGETDAVADWIESHIRTRRDMHEALELLGRLIYEVFPLALTKDAIRDDKSMWALEASDDANPRTLAAAQIVTASLNGDWDTLTALIRAMVISPDEEHHGDTLVLVLHAYQQGLVALTAVQPNGVTPKTPDQPGGGTR